MRTYAEMLAGRSARRRRCAVLGALAILQRRLIDSKFGSNFRDGQKLLVVHVGDSIGASGLSKCGNGRAVRRDEQQQRLWT